MNTQFSSVVMVLGMDRNKSDVMPLHIFRVELKLNTKVSRGSGNI